MKNIPNHTVYLQDGSLCNFKKLIWKKATSLLSCLKHISDPRHKRGIRHEVSLMLFILFAAMTTGCTTLKDCHLWAIHNKKFLLRYFPLLHGIPDPTTFSYLLQTLSPEELCKAYLKFLHLLGVSLGDIVSADGKTMRAVSGSDSIRHILSLFTHITHLVVGQIGVNQKENEIPSLRRLLKENPDSIMGKLLLADALHTNAETTESIITVGGDYLFVVKGNQKDLFADISLAFMSSTDLAGTNYRSCSIPIDICTQQQEKRKRSITTTVTSTTDQALCSYLIKNHGFAQIKTIGILRREGTRKTKDGTIVPIDETICFISSRKLASKQILEMLREHWCIENLLHWVKDLVFLEDRQTLRKGNAPQIMSLLRGMCISICNLVKFRSISEALHNFQKHKPLQYQFLRMAAIV